MDSHDGSLDFLKEKQVSAPSTIDESGGRRWLYPDRRPGPHATRRMWIAVVLIAFYIVVPWINFNGRPLLRIDVLGQQAHIFGLALKMTEYTYIFFILAILAVTLFLVTTLRGRIWCGYACPQTVFVDWVIRPLEELWEGPALKRAKQDKGPMTKGLFLRKFGKHFSFIVVSLVVAHGFLGFFIDPRLIAHWVFSPPQLHFTAFCFVMGVSALLYFDLGYFREQFCAFLCPYARFQAAMLDNSSPSVTYDRERGEPRGRSDGHGDCIDCGLCVRVCPTGIDIRNGLQLECIQCERCMDACDSIMINLKRKPQLIRIASVDELEGKAVPVWRRPRIYIYCSLIFALAAVGTLKIQSRPTLALTFLRGKSQTYTQAADGQLSNMFQVRINNTSDKEQRLHLQLVSPATGIKLICPACDKPIEPFAETVAPLFVIFSKDEQVEGIVVRTSLDETQYTLPLLKPGIKLEK